MWKQFVKDYLTFTKAERRAVLVLLVLILLVFVLPYWWPMARPVVPDKLAIEQLQQQTAGSKHATANEKYGNTASGNNPPVYTQDERNRFKGPLFCFDPNTLPADGWKHLGLRDKTIQTILHYRERGGRFRQPADISRIYGLLPDEYARLLPYIKIAPQPVVGNTGTAPGYAPSGRQTGGGKQTVYPATPHFRPPAVPIEINTADTTAFIALPGIAGRLVNRIVQFRDNLGGFYSVDQIGEVYALPDSVFRLIKPRLQCDSTAVRRININTADAAALKQHPYIRWNIANAIVAYRGQHGEYTSVAELLRIEIITPELLQKLRPYLDVR